MISILASCSTDLLNPLPDEYTCVDYASGTCDRYSSDEPCPPAPLELCDGVDNDCNGKIDEVDGTTGLPCDEPSLFECVDFATCEAYASQEPCPDAPPELCDGVDNNCNGEIDEWNVTPGTPCPVEQPQEIRFTVTYRDFMRHDAVGGHPSFEWASAAAGVTAGIVKAELDSDGKPLLNENGADAHASLIHSQEEFRVWYRDSSYSRTITEELTFGRQPDGSYLLGSDLFFPLDNRGWAEDGTEQHYQAVLPTGEVAGMHNFYFTTELRFDFIYRGAETIEFLGDDDVWVFINSKLAIDVGGIHAAEPGAVTLTSTTATALGLEVGATYEVAIFHAERHVAMSTFALSLNGFDFVSEQLW